MPNTDPLLKFVLEFANQPTLEAARAYLEAHATSLLVPKAADLLEGVAKSAEAGFYSSARQYAQRIRQREEFLRRAIALGISAAWAEHEKQANAAHTNSAGQQEITVEQARRAAHYRTYLAELIGLSASDPRLGEIQERLRGMLDQAEGSTPPLPALPQHVLDWLNTPSFREQREYLAAHRELLDTQAESILSTLIDQYHGQAEQERFLRASLVWLQRARIDGLDAGWAAFCQSFGISI